jgi:hypothetical protein
MVSDGHGDDDDGGRRQVVLHNLLLYCREYNRRRGACSSDFGAL